MTTKAMLRTTRTKTKRSRRGAAFRGAAFRGAAFRSAVILGAVLGFATLAVVPRAAANAAETTKVPKLRTIEGEVCSKNGSPVQGAVVYLKDAKSLAVKSYLSDDQGHFHFRHLSMSLDYDLWAELNGERSRTRSISQFNSRPDLRYRLKLPISK